MKVMLDLTQDEFAELHEAAQARFIARAVRHHKVRHEEGRGSREAIEAGVLEARAERVFNAIKAAGATLTPQRAMPPRDLPNAPRTQNLQVGDDLALVYGRPRNDPRNPRRKRSNAARKGGGVAHG